MKYSAAVVVFCAVLVVSTWAQTPSSSQGTQVTYGSAYDDIVVESSLNVRKKPTPLRQAREIIYYLQPIPLARVKRQFGGNGNFGGGNGNFGNFGNQDYSSSSALANANAYNQQFRPDGFGASAANAGAQAFQTQGPLGGFGASASNAQSQGFNVGPNGFSGSAGLSGGQTYNLPNGQTLALTYANGVSIGPDGKPTVSKGNSIAFTGGNQ